MSSFLSDDLSAIEKDEDHAIRFKGEDIILAISGREKMLIFAIFP